MMEQFTPVSRAKDGPRDIAEVLLYIVVDKLSNARLPQGGPVR